MRRIKIRKRSGGYRTIYQPSHKEKEALRQSLHDRQCPAASIAGAALVLVDGMKLSLDDIVAAKCSASVHGFFPGRSPVTCAIPHIGYQFTLSMDIKDFFDSVTGKHLDMFDKSYIPDRAMIAHRKSDDAAPRQGLPTSPAIANIAAVSLDQRIEGWCFDNQCVYTRYADDVTVSGNDKAALLSLRDELHKDSGMPGIVFSDKKTRLQWCGPDRTWTREVVGVGVNHERILPLRTTRKKLRAALHTNPHSNRARGLQEWASLKRPAPVDTSGMRSAYFGARALYELSH
jgi:hypothetical protein